MHENNILLTKHYGIDSTFRIRLSFIIWRVNHFYIAWKCCLYWVENSFGHLRGDLLRDGLPRLRGVRLHQLRRHLHLQDEVQGLCQGPHPPPDDQVHCKKRLTIFPSLAGMSLTKLSLAGNYFRPEKVWLVTSRRGRENGKPFFTVYMYSIYLFHGQDTHQIVRSLEITDFLVCD